MPGSTIFSAASVEADSVTAGSSDHLPAWSFDFCAAVAPQYEPLCGHRPCSENACASWRLGVSLAHSGLPRHGQAERRLPADGQGVVLDGRGGVRGGGGGDGEGGEGAAEEGARKGRIHARKLQGFVMWIARSWRSIGPDSSMGI